MKRAKSLQNVSIGISFVAQQLQHFMEEKHYLWDLSKCVTMRTIVQFSHYGVHLVCVLCLLGLL